jgi:hypothetical protein
MDALVGPPLEAFHNYMAGIVPTVVSVSVPDPEDRSTWVVECEPPATPEQQVQIDTAISDYIL